MEAHSRETCRVTDRAPRAAPTRHASRRVDVLVSAVPRKHKVLGTREAEFFAWRCNCSRACRHVALSVGARQPAGVFDCRTCNKRPSSSMSSQCRPRISHAQSAVKRGIPAACRRRLHYARAPAGASSGACPGCTKRRGNHHEERTMRRLGLALALLPCLAAPCSAQDASDFHPASTNVWDAQYPRVDSTGRVEDPTQGARRHEGPAELLERAESRHGEAAGWRVERHHPAARARACITTR